MAYTDLPWPATRLMQSCTDLVNVRELSRRRTVWRGLSACEWGELLGETLGCPRGGGQLDRMRAVSVEQLLQQSFCPAATDCYEPAADRRGLPAGRSTRGSPLCATLDTAHPRTSLEAAREGRLARVPVLLGVTVDDGLGQPELEWTYFEDCSTVEEYAALLKRHLGSARRDAALSLFDASSAREVRARLAELSNHLWYHAGTWLTANLLVRQASGRPVIAPCVAPLIATCAAPSSLDRPLIVRGSVDCSRPGRPPSSCTSWVSRAARGTAPTFLSGGRGTRRRGQPPVPRPSARPRQRPPRPSPRRVTRARVVRARPLRRPLRRRRRLTEARRWPS